MQRAEHWVLPGAVLLLGAVILLRPGPAILVGIDAPIYARIARELCTRPLHQWYDLTLNGGSFYEHPPGYFWLQALAFRFCGATAATAVWLVRGMAVVVAWLTFMVARRLAPQAAAGALVGLSLLSGFLYVSQIPMLEVPLTAALLLAAIGALQLQKSKMGGASLFAAGLTAAAWVKGPPAAAALGILLFCVLRRGLPWRRALAAAGLGLVAVGGSVAAFEMWRRHHGAPPFFSHYLQQQVITSLRVGRNHPVSSLLFYPRTLWRWYPVGVLGAAVAAALRLRRRRHRQAAAWALIELGGVWVALIVVGFSVARQKYQWYIHPTAPGFAWILGGLGALLAARRPTWRPAGRALLGIAVLGYGLLYAAVPARLRTHRPEVERAHALPAPAFGAGEPRRIANCSSVQGWYGDHLFGFLWSAQAVPCHNPQARWRFDGQRLLPVGGTAPLARRADPAQSSPSAPSTHAR